MVLHYIGLGLAILGGLGILFVGVRYLTAPATIAPGFGLPEWPEGRTAAWLTVKGGRDVTFGLLPFALWAFDGTHALAIYMLVASIAAAGDMIAILRYRGSRTIAFSVHGATAAAMILSGVFLLVG